MILDNGMSEVHQPDRQNDQSAQMIIGFFISVEREITPDDIEGQILILSFTEDLLMDRLTKLDYFARVLLCNLGLCPHINLLLKCSSPQGLCPTFWMDSISKLSIITYIMTGIMAV